MILEIVSSKFNRNYENVIRSTEAVSANTMDMNERRGIYLSLSSTSIRTEKSQINFRYKPICDIFMITVLFTDGQTSYS